MRSHLLRRAVAASILAALAAAGPAAAQTPPSAVTLKAPSSLGYGKPLRLTGTVTPPAAQPVQVTIQPPGGAPQRLAAGTTRADGTFVLKARAVAPGQLVAQTAAAASPPVALTVAPRLTARWSGTRLPGGRIALKGRLVPAAAGAIAVGGNPVRVGRDGRFRAAHARRAGGPHAAPACGCAAPRAGRSSASGAAA